MLIIIRHYDFFSSLNGIIILQYGMIIKVIKEGLGFYLRLREKLVIHL